jgi:hypothetical protein
MLKPIYLRKIWFKTSSSKYTGFYCEPTMNTTRIGFAEKTVFVEKGLGTEPNHIFGLIGFGF